MTQAMEQCPACGAAVPANELARIEHERFHDRLRDLEEKLRGILK